MNNELPKMRFSEFARSNVARAREVLSENGAYELTADGEPVCVIMTWEQYHAFKAVNPSLPRQPKMVRVEGALYREVI